MDFAAIGVSAPEFALADIDSIDMSIERYHRAAIAYSGDDIPEPVNNDIVRPAGVKFLFEESYYIFFFPGIRGYLYQIGKDSGGILPVFFRFFSKIFRFNRCHILSLAAKGNSSQRNLILSPAR
jgi:hypothetical protein